jgi:hypothetical protein
VPYRVLGATQEAVGCMRAPAGGALHVMRHSPFAGLGFDWQAFGGYVLKLRESVQKRRLYSGSAGTR